MESCVVLAAALALEAVLALEGVLALQTALGSEVSPGPGSGHGAMALETVLASQTARDSEAVGGSTARTVSSIRSIGLKPIAETYQLISCFSGEASGVSFGWR